MYRKGGGIMTTFLRELFESLEKTNISKKGGGPDGPIEPRDHLVGDMNEDLKKLYVLLNESTRNIRRLTLHHDMIEGELKDSVLDGQITKESMEGQTDLVEARRKLYAEESRHNALKGIFWHSIRV